MRQQATLYNKKNNDLNELGKLCEELYSSVSDYAVHLTANNKNIDGNLEEVLDFFSEFVSENSLSWYSKDDNCFHSIPKNFNNKLREFILWMRSNNQHVIFMSGTLTKVHESRDIELDWNLSSYNDDEFMYYNYPQTFDYKQQAIIYNNISMPRPSNKNDFHLDAINREISKFLNWKGGVLILNSSKLYMESIYTNLEKNEKSRTVLKQGDKTVETLTAQFKKDEESILVGSGAFFSGISVPGNSLRTLILTKLPFPTPDDPLMKVKSINSVSDNFVESPVFLHMIMQLKQGFGRLIRDVTDKGVIVVLDPRLSTSKYAEYLNDVLRDDKYEVVTSLNKVIEFEGTEWKVDESENKPVFIPKTSRVRKVNSTFGWLH